MKNWCYNIEICAISFPHGQIQHDLWYLLAENNCNHKMHICVTSPSIMDRFNMCFHLIFLRKNVITKFTFLWPFPLMERFSMGFQSILLWTTLIAKFTFVWLLTMDKFNMSFQCTLLWTTAVTKNTFFWFDSPMTDSTCFFTWPF